MWIQYDTFYTYTGIKLETRWDEMGWERTGTGQDGTGQDRTGQDRTGQDRTGQDECITVNLSSVLVHLTQLTLSPTILS